MGGILLINLAIGLSVGFIGVGIDNAAHIGGLVTGFILGALIQPTRAEAMRRRWTSAVTGRRGGEIAVMLVLGVILFVLFSNWFELALWRDRLPL